MREFGSCKALNLLKDFKMTNKLRRKSLRKIIEYVEAIGRNPGEEKQHSHLYALDDRGDYTPMCVYGWNRSDGERFSIFRGHSGSKGLCKTCLKRAQHNLHGVEAKENSHKTKWI